MTTVPPADSDSPDWTRVHFEVPCLSCGVNLHGTGESRCPQCAIALNWARVLPLEALRCRTCGYQLFGLTQPRCPECGEAFEWGEALGRARQQRVELFETRWWDEPAPALVRTWWLAAVRPGRLWAAYAHAGHARVLPLLLFIALQWLMFAKGWEVVALAADPIMNTLGAGQTPPVRFVYPRHLSPRFDRWLATWQVATFISLLTFVESNRQYGADWRRILRVFVHATVFASMLPALWCILEMLADTSYLFTPRAGPLARRLYDLIETGMLCSGIGVSWLYLGAGYRRHLHMPHAWAVAGLAMIFGFLLTELVFIFV